MPIYETPYYGTRRKALTGQGYGPYYGMSLTGGGALPPEGRRALSPEISDKYGTTGTPAITEGAEGVASPALEGSMATTPGASWGQVAYSMGLGMPFGIGNKALGIQAPPGTPQMKGGLVTGALKSAAKYGVSKAIGTSIPSTIWSVFMRNFIDPLLSKAFPNLFTFPPLGGMPNISLDPMTGRAAVDRSISPLSETAAFTGLNTSDIFGVFSKESMSTPTGQAAALSALGSTAALGSSEAALEGFASGFGIGAFGGGTSTGFGSGAEGGEGASTGW